jgi:predicted nucleic acid-binding Zn ribbon protein
MENHHHCRICDDVVSPDRKVCDKCSERDAYGQVEKSELIERFQKARAEWNDYIAKQNKTR